MISILDPVQDLNAVTTKNLEYFRYSLTHLLTHSPNHLLTHSESEMEQPYIDIVLPTFRLEPDESERFYPSVAKAVADSVLVEELNGQVNISQ